MAESLSDEFKTLTVQECSDKCQLPPLPPIIEKSKSSHKTKSAELPHFVREWSEFDGLLAASHGHYEVTYGAFWPGAEIGQETDLYSMLCCALNGPLINSLDLVVRPSNGRSLAVCDRILCENSTRERIAQIEMKLGYKVKHFATTPLPQLWQVSINKGEQESKIIRVLSQVNGYLKASEDKYCILSTYDCTWFIKRIDGGLEISCGVPKETGCKLLSGFALLTRMYKGEENAGNGNRDAGGISGGGSGISGGGSGISGGGSGGDDGGGRGQESLVGGSGRGDRGSHNRKSNDALYLGKALVSPSQIFFHDSDYILVKSHYGEVPAIVKVVDVVKRPEAFQLLLAEADFYKEMAPSQGVHIPVLFASGWIIQNLLWGIVISDEGTSLKELSRSVSAVALESHRQVASHIADLLRARYRIDHGDLKDRNVVVDSSDRVKLIDFGLSSLIC